jgi:exosortase/archaeosortase family protein
MFSLSALGILYLYLMQYRNWFRNGLILASILPIAFAANVVRVIIITLITYYWGDEAGQGFIHGFAGIVLFIVALLSFMLWDWILELIFKQRRCAT